MEKTYAEDRLFDALAVVFNLNPKDSIDVSKVAACAIAAHVMEVGVFKGDPDARRTAFARIREMREELDDMFTQAQSMSAEAHTS